MLPYLPPKIRLLVWRVQVKAITPRYSFSKPHNISPNCLLYNTLDTLLGHRFFFYEKIITLWERAKIFITGIAPEMHPSIPPNLLDLQVFTPFILASLRPLLASIVLWTFHGLFPSLSFEKNSQSPSSAAIFDTWISIWTKALGWSVLRLQHLIKSCKTLDQWKSNCLGKDIKVIYKKLGYFNS